MMSSDRSRLLPAAGAVKPAAKPAVESAVEPAVDADASDLLLSFEPLSLLDSSPIYNFFVDGRQPTEKTQDLSPGGRKKQLFLQRLERRGLSHSDPEPRRILH